MVVVHQGKMTVQNKLKVGVDECAVFVQNNDQEEVVKFSSNSDETRFLFLAGQPMNEPIAAHGPFVLNDREQLYQAFEDYQMGKNGFENSNTWQSDISALRFKARTY